MKVIYVQQGKEIKMLDIEDEDKKVLEGIFNYNLFRKKEDFTAEYFYFYDKRKKITSERYYINQKPVDVKEMRNIDKIYAEFMKMSNIDKAVVIYDIDGKIVQFDPVYDNDKFLTVK
jgi:hypothetical protein